MIEREPMTHARAIELLPWLVNDSLAEDERDSVSEHARSCVICRREMAELRALHQSVRAGAESARIPDADMRRINARIDASLARESSVRDRWRALRGMFDSPWRIAFAAQTVVLVVVVGLLLWRPAVEPEFRTMTSVESLPAGHFVRVVFDPTLDETLVADIISSHGLAVVSGPSPRGVRTLRVGDSLDAAGRAKLGDTLRQDSRILFVQELQGAR